MTHTIEFNATNFEEWLGEHYRTVWDGQGNKCFLEMYFNEKYKVDDVHVGYLFTISNKLNIVAEMPNWAKKFVSNLGMNRSTGQHALGVLQDVLYPKEKKYVTLHP